jgi:hypothetical protein
MLERLQGYTWAAEVNEGGPGRAAARGTDAGAAGGVTFAPIEIDDSWLDAAG